MFKTKLPSAVNAIFALTGKKEGEYVEASDLVSIDAALTEAASAIDAKDILEAKVTDLTAKLGAATTTTETAVADATKPLTDKVTALEKELSDLKAANPGATTITTNADDKGHKGGEGVAEESESTKALNIARLNMGMEPLKIN
jgi:flagellar hook-basal body complex protein FliE